MTQRDRDRLVVLKKAQKKLITQRQAAVELQLSERQVRRLLVRLREVGDRAVVHGLRQRPSNRRLSEEVRESAVRILSQQEYRGFGPTLASEYLAQKHKIRIGREALRQLMQRSGLWRSRKRRAATGWQPGGSVSPALSRRPGLRGAPQSGIIPQAGAAALVPSAPFGRHTRRHAAVSPIGKLTGVGRGQDRQNPDLRPAGRLKTQQGRRAKIARRSSRCMYPKTTAQKLHPSSSVLKNQNPQNGQHRARFDWGSGAVCHFYLALTGPVAARRRAFSTSENAGRSEITMINRTTLSKYCRTKATFPSV